MSNYIFSPSPNYGVSEHSFITWEDAFNEEELNTAIEYFDSLPKNKADIADNVEENISHIRTSTVSWVELTPESSWIYDRLAWIARCINGQYYNFDLYGFSEDFQYTIYESDNLGHYTWHTDNGVTNQQRTPRKLSIVLQLSNPEDYEGGDLEIFTQSEPIKVMKKRGLLAAFPSYRLHRVTPVTSGIRKTLVIWVCGPSFR
jgi:PKHD-type hydroxylase